MMFEQSVITACQDSTFIVHVASPLTETQDEDEVILPAMSGTMAALNAAQ